jgi:hypothetical protein
LRGAIGIKIGGQTSHIHNLRSFCAQSDHCNDSEQRRYKEGPANFTKPGFPLHSIFL